MCFFDDQTKTATAWLGSSDSSTVFNRHCIVDFIYFSLYKILSMEKNSVLWKTAKGTWNSSLLKMIKSFGKMELLSCLKMAEVDYNAQ